MLRALSGSTSWRGTTWYRITFPNGATFEPFTITPAAVGVAGRVPGGAAFSINYSS